MADVEIPYGRDAHGRMRHCSEVESGLACDCVCAGCGGRLVAYKGKQKQYHFGHHSKHACAGAAETALHKFAKQVILENALLALPPLIVGKSGEERLIRKEGKFAYHAARHEVRLPNMQPDVIVRVGERELLVEIAVAHPCEDVKLALLRERQLAAIEIDLSKIARNAGADIHTDAVLNSAPRHWLYNRIVEQENASLESELAEKQAADSLLNDAKWGDLITQLNRERVLPFIDGDPDWLNFILECNLGDCVGIPTAGNNCFVFKPETWQSAVFSYFVLNSDYYNKFHASTVLKKLQQAGFVKNAFTRLPTLTNSDLEKYVKSKIENHIHPIEAIEATLEHAASRGILTKGRKYWSSHTERARDARSRADAADRARNRLKELDKLFGEVIGAAGQEGIIDFATWAAVQHDGLKGTPEQIAGSGGIVFEALKEQLITLRGIARPGAAPISGNLLGLPLERHRKARQAEADRRIEEAARRIEEAAELAKRRAIERTKVRIAESASFVERMKAEAMEALGSEEGPSWIARHLPNGAVTADAIELDSTEMKTIESKFDSEKQRLLSDKISKARAAEETIRCQDRLRADAARDPKLFSPDRLEAWLKNGHPQLTGKRPLDYCIDKKTLETCLTILPSRLAKVVRRKL